MVKMKLLLLAIALSLLIIDLKVSQLISFLAGIIIPLMFYLVTKDKANTLRLAILGIGFLPMLPHPHTPTLAAVASILINDERIRAIKKWRLIVFSGADGSGKSTHARATAHWLRSLGIDVAYYHFFKHPLVSALSNAKRKVMRVSLDEMSAYAPGFRRHLRSHILPKLRPIVQYIDNWLFIGGRILLDMLHGRWVIADRFFYDFFVRFKCLGYPMPSILELLYLKVVPHPHLLVIFDVSPEISFKRRRHEHPLWYYRKARGEYRRIACQLNAPILNTERDFDEVQQELETLIVQRLIRGVRIPQDRRD